MFFFFSFEAENTKHCLCLPSYGPFESFLGPRQILTPKVENAKDVFPHSLTLDSPWDVLTSVDLDIFPRSFFLLFPCRFTAHPKILYFLQRENSDSTIRCQLPASPFLSRSICSMLLLEWDIIQKLSAHMDLQIVCALSPHRKSKKTRILFLVQFSSTFAKSCVAIFLPKSGSFDVFLTEGAN